MDPVSIVASAKTLVSVCSKLTDLINQQRSIILASVASVDSDVKRLRRSLEQLQTCLLEDESAKEQCARSRHHITESLSGSRIVLEELAEFLSSPLVSAESGLPSPVVRDIQRRLRAQNDELRKLLQAFEPRSPAACDDDDHVDPPDRKHIVGDMIFQSHGMSEGTETGKRIEKRVENTDPSTGNPPTALSRNSQAVAPLILAAAGACVMAVWVPNGTCSTNTSCPLSQDIKVLLNAHPKLDALTNSPITLITAMATTGFSLTAHHYNLARKGRKFDLLVLGVVGGGTLVSLLLGVDGMTNLLRVAPVLGILAFLLCGVPVDRKHLIGLGSSKNELGLGAGGSELRMSGKMGEGQAEEA
ncbi:hypothetical protein B0T16DRAFT_453580 [Cercophora newfieldiana]|uniref:Uncharacterized protein n=1 Tax=Cercophora newfieldiana TaxID=92897 RepID=A0AA39YHE9_9PEZI|nr:hypothetical protein B0T16DRAFT_453580 [Cercophora newfieldiana]